MQGERKARHKDVPQINQRLYGSSHNKEVWWRAQLAQNMTPKWKFQVVTAVENEREAQRTRGQPGPKRPRLQRPAYREYSRYSLTA